ncbi:hypothetical protein KSP35_10425 [Aquihabitans sp. G128]|uniref:hypothetical protein n=1 Tax=Aquihabitans sp. G128 TaxID=2849779 RepID=UPI001C231060|nr:hypothetical protein [Aquihabitans sp. G128]QXC63155.1 hypothetical protein KSP35_10425 [Aquihabitans sp. G128]
MERHLVPRTLAALAVAGLLASCGSSADDGSQPTRSTTVPTADEDASRSPAADAPAAGPSKALRAAAATPDGLLAVVADGGRLQITVTAGPSPVLALSDLSAAQVEVDGDHWQVSLARPDGGRGQDADRAASWAALVVQAGDSVAVGPYELGPKPPSSVEVCLEVVVPTTAQARRETGTAVRLPDRDGPASLLCRAIDL